MNVIALSDAAYCYEVRLNDALIGYEVFLRKKTALCLDFKNRIYSEKEFKEVYPKSQHFGEWAWGYFRKESAMTKFNEL